MIANAAKMGAYMLDRMRDWPKKFKHVGDVRGLGLMIGFELVQRSRDQGTCAGAARAYSINGL